MPDAFLEFAASSNGDRWLLGRDPDSGTAYVLHQANGPSGGARSRIEIVDFLDRTRLSPEHRALLVTMGTLVSGSLVSQSKSGSPASSADNDAGPTIDGGTLQ